MKKLLGIMVLGLLLSSNAYAICDLVNFESKAKKTSSKYVWYQHTLGREYLKTWDDVELPPDFPLKDCKIEKNIEKGKKLIRQAIKHNYVPSLVFVGWSHYKGENGYEKNIKAALDYSEKAARIGNENGSRYSWWGYSNLGYFYYTGEELKQDLEKATTYYIEAARQVLWIMGHEKKEGLYNEKDWDSNVKSFIEEINEVPNPTPEMIKLRDAYTKFLKDRSYANLKSLEKMGKYYVKSCYDEVKFVWRKKAMGVEFNFSNPSNKTIRIKDVVILTEKKEVIAEKKDDLVMPPFTENFTITIPKGNLMLELAKFGNYTCETMEKGYKAKEESRKKKLIEKIFGD